MNSATFPTLFEQYTPPAMRLAYRILGSQDAAADAVQEGLIKAFHAISRFEGGNARAWFMRIVTNTCLDHLRTQKRRAAYSLEAFAEEFGDERPDIIDRQHIQPDQHLLQSEAAQAILDVIEQLPDCYRLVLQRVDVEGYEYAEVAEQLGLPMGTVKSRLCRARVIVRNKLVDKGLCQHKC